LLYVAVFDQGCDAINPLDLCLRHHPLKLEDVCRSSSSRCSLSPHATAVLSTSDKVFLPDAAYQMVRLKRLHELRLLLRFCVLLLVVPSFPLLFLCF
jgi:hypothetical protein